MTKTEALMRYKAAVSVFKKWLSSGFITKRDFDIINTNTAEKYGISLSSIYVDFLSI